MKYVVRATVVVALVATGCGSDGTEPVATNASEPAATEAPEPPATDAPEPDPEPATTDAPEPAASSGGPADLAITAIEFGGAITVTNLGDAPVDVTDLWLCNRPSYAPMPATSIAPGESISITDLPTADVGGEVALYTSNSFGDSASIIDYVAWGTGGGRAAVAADAGIWPGGDTVPAAGTGIAAPTGGSTSADWTST